MQRSSEKKKFSIQFHEGERDNLHISVVGQRVILVVIFDKRSSLGLVRLRVKKASEDLTRSIQKLLNKMAAGVEQENVLKEITDDDIEKLFH